MSPEPRILGYLRWLRAQRGLDFTVGDEASYDALWRWSTGDLDAFWRSIWDHFDLRSPTPVTTVLADARMPGARWFPGVQVNYAQQVMRHADAAHAAGHPAIVHADEAMLARGELGEVSWPELRRQVASLAARLRAMGVAPGDRVVAVLPNTPQTVVAFLACASVGAVWSVCSPDMGPVAVLDRFRQIEPKVLIACDGYVFGGVAHDRRPLLHQLLAELPTLTDVVVWPRLDAGTDAQAFAGARRRAHEWGTLVADDVAFEPAWLPFDHPLWIVYSSGTTGLPKAIVHGHGGVMLEALKLGVLHNDVGASVDTGDRFHWYSSTGWIMWNCQVGGLLGGTTICLFDGSPAGPHGAPDWTTLWRFAGLAGATFFGAGAAFYASCLKADVKPQHAAALSRLRAVGSTGSPLAVEGYRWIWERLPRVDGERIWLTSISGGTDFAGAFIAGLRTLPVVEGEMQCRCLGAAVEAWDEQGRALVDEVGELVCTKPMPSMPLYLWNDPDGTRLHDSYFDVYPGVWRHGDWIRITPRGGAIIYGRSDATINRHGIRMGTAELYRAVEALPEVLDSLVVDLEYLGRESYMPLFVVLRDGVVLDAALEKRIRDEIRTALSPRHVPSEIVQVKAIPRTLSGKKMELPVKKLLLGADPAKVMNRDAMANADCVDWYVEFARRRAAGAG
ncbi:acetoacetate--CoA ligase [Calidifontimicrobium sp. SYSU G02091]|uniref:acetoacetate--CoA ligase n=1 Tax=Calidifontimicrobium sp. SYSU G02091 TaxID=2926421 RepID=UPI001F5370DC|nr:acetoacetate--CoA ligase [Calidifontimicrobium sp. SYSU G02091]MCI1190225.1 acetoacetate--CoA ligase [Calidifontimicrobium sp. SYSU G02091]